MPARGGCWRSTACCSIRVSFGVGRRGHRRGVGGVDRAHQLADAAPFLRRDVVVMGERRGSASLRSNSRLTSSRRSARQPVPLVDADDQRAPGIEDVAGEVRILLGDVLLRVEQQHDDVGVLDRLQRLDHREFLDRLDHLAAAAHAGGVDQRVAAAVALEIEVDRIARRARLVEGDHPLLAEQRVDERRLADVRPADDRDLDRRVGVGAIVGQRRLAGSSGAAAAGTSASAISTSARDVLAVRRRNGVRLAEAQLVELGGGALRRRGLPPCWRRAPRVARSGAGARRSSGPAASARRGASTRKITTSASAIACRVCFAISCMMPSFATGSKPPVSTTRNGRSPMRARP